MRVLDVAGVIEAVGDGSWLAVDAGGNDVLAIDALGSLVEGLGDRLGPDEEALRDALAQIRLAFVQIKNAGGAPPQPEAGDEG